MISSQKRLFGLSGWKFLAMIMIVWWHLGIPSGKIDWGARMCEFLFVSSGFLVGYNYYYKGMPDTRRYSFKYVFDKLSKVYPLHLLTTIFFVILTIKNFQISDIPSWLSNLFLLQAWQINKDVIIFNGVSWFLSALMFCYFLTPFFLRLVRNIKHSLVLLLLVATVRVSIEAFQIFGLADYVFSMHYSPLIRVLEFFMGMLLIPYYFKLKKRIKKQENKKWFIAVVSIIEILIICITIFFMYIFNSLWLRAFYVIWFCILVFILGFDYGITSKIMSCKLAQKVVNLQLEAFMLQYIAGYIIDKSFQIMNINTHFFWVFILKLAVLLVMAFIYQRFVSRKMADLFVRICKVIRILLI